MHSLPAYTTDSQVTLSEIQVTYNSCIVPRHIFEDSLRSESYSFNQFATIDGPNVIYPRRFLQKIQILRERSYRPCVWVPKIPSIVPITESKILSVTNVDDIKRILELNIPDYQLLKICTSSNTFNYNNSREAIRDILYLGLGGNILLEPHCEGCQSKHLFFRKKKSYYWKVRCFWSQDRLRAVSLPELTHLNIDEKTEIINFFFVYGRYFPYHSAVVDIGKTSNGIEIIDFSPFGPDMNISAGNFQWEKHAMTLIFSQNVIFL